MSVASAWIGSKWAVKLDSLSERLTRGIGPCSSRSISGTSGAFFRGSARPRDEVQAGLLVQIGFGSLITASPSRSAVNASDLLRRPTTVWWPRPAWRRR